MAEQKRQRPEDIATLRGSTLGELHDGRMRLEEKHPILKKMVKLSFAANIGSAAAVFVLFSAMRWLGAADRPFLWALMWFFIFGCIYGMFAFLSFIYACYAERKQVELHLTPNRRYQWHTRYDTQNMRDEEIKKVPNPGKKPADKLPPPPGSAGQRYYRHAALLVLCSFASCMTGIYAFLHTVFRT